MQAACSSGAGSRFIGGLHLTMLPMKQFVSRDRPMEREHPVQELAGRADEGQPRLVLLGAGALADDHDEWPARALAGHDAVSAGRQPAALAPHGLCGYRIEAVVGRNAARRRFVDACVFLDGKLRRGPAAVVAIEEVVFNGIQGLVDGHSGAGPGARIIAHDCSSSVPASARSISPKPRVDLKLAASRGSPSRDSSSIRSVWAMEARLPAGSLSSSRLAQ